MAEPDSEPSFDDRFLNNLPDYVTATPIDGDPFERAAQRVRAPYEKANRRESGLPDVLNVIGGRVKSGLTAPLDALTGKLQVNDPETNMPTQEAIGRSMDTAALAGGGIGGAEEGALGMTGGKLLNRQELERMKIEDLDRMAYGHASGDVVQLNPKDINIKYKDDLINPKDKFKKQGMDWVNSVNLKEPVQVSIDQNGKFNLEDGHHRWFAAGKRNEPLTAEIEVKGKPIETILERQGNKLNAGSLPVTFTPVDGDPHKSANTVGDAIDTAAKQYGLNPTVLKGIASIESSWEPGSNRNKTTQYKGLFQIGKEEWKQHGNGDIYNAKDNANAAAKMLSEHAQWFKDNYGRDPTPGEFYMMHQQGRGFISNGTMTNIGGNPYPGMRGPQTPETFKQGWSDTLARKMAQFGGADSISDGTERAPSSNVKVASNDSNFKPSAHNSPHKFTPVDFNPFDLVNHANHVPYGAGASDTPSGYPVNIDKRIPQHNDELKLPDGEPADLHKYLTIHEIEEYKAMKNGTPYHTAHHDIATPMEKKAVESDGVDWKKYEHILNGYLKETEKEGYTDLPKGLYLKPYHSRSLIEKEKKNEK